MILFFLRSQRECHILNGTVKLNQINDEYYEGHWDKVSPTLPLEAASFYTNQ